MSRLQTGAMQLVMREVGLEEVGSEGARRRCRSVRRRSCSTSPRRCRGCAPTPGLLERAVANVVDNARAWSPPDQPVRVEAGAVPKRVDLRVIDHGPGIPVDQRDLVFQPFQRLGDNPRNGTEVGLGLAVARGLPGGDGRRGDGRGHSGRRRHHGAEPPVGRGVTATGPSPRVLVVDDEPQIRRALGVNLRARGYQVDLAETGEEALELAARNHPDVVVLDLGLPGIGGVEVIQGLRGWSSVPVIVLSVRESERDKVGRAGRGCRRLRHQAVRDGRAARPACAPPYAGPRRRTRRRSW